MMTTRTWIAIVAVAGAVIFATATALANDNDSTATCPDGQTLKAHQVNGDKFTETKAVPDGGTITDSVSGEGLDYTQVVSSDSVTLNIKGGGPATLTITCR